MDKIFALSSISAPKCVRLSRKSKSFSLEVPLSNSSQKNCYCPTLRGISEATNRNIEKASHPLLAHHVLSDIVSLDVRGLASSVIFAFKGLRVPIKNKKKRYYFRILQFISLTIIYYGGPQVHTECKSLTPNSNYSHRIQITHTEFKLLTPNSNHSHRIQITHTEIKSLTLN